MSPQDQPRSTNTNDNQCQGGIPGICRDRDGFTAYLRYQSNTSVNVADLRAQWRRAVSDPTTGHRPRTDPPGGTGSSGLASSLLANVGSPPNTHASLPDHAGHANGNHNPNQSNDRDRSHIGAWCEYEEDEAHNDEEDVTRNNNSETQHGEDDGQGRS
ncbi:hypothetical protein K469DRAFT_789803 [Zopfia rhizophila CBS 207.26]|uniref:Uncharacterized protein n=1 Tax=Zopfia rhizophila CBS 207.26 TaxID=1314779 RepID=A0A6A6ESI6_9PEZI|nr:hypothetical protein K469DRAFT_789803 [Zopfia rhizophila CBS 207.26]